MHVPNKTGILIVSIWGLFSVFNKKEDLNRRLPITHLKGLKVQN